MKKLSVFLTSLILIVASVVLSAPTVYGQRGGGRGGGHTLGRSGVSLVGSLVLGRQY
jgi:hypothetical protein